MTAPAGAVHSPVVAARKVAAAGAPSDDFTYAVLPEPAAVAGAAERRMASRRRMRLRSGKVLGHDGRFVIECLIANRSMQGGLLRLPEVVPLPPRILVYEDQSGELLAAIVVWRRGRDLGIRFALGEHGERDGAIAASMRRKFYAMRG